MISAPEDYGLTVDQILTHQCTIPPPKRFDSFWRQFREELHALNTNIIWPCEPGQHEVEFRSIRDVRVMARVTIPEPPVGGAVVTTHGAIAPDIFTEEATAWSKHPLITIELRVRGYPPSVRDTGDLRNMWITHGIEDPEAWILRGAVADVTQVCRCVRAHLSPGQLLTLHGESLGGGLAVIAASQLQSLNEAVDRLVVALPSLGDWAWRADRYCNGAGAHVNDVLDLCRGTDRQAFIENLLLFDAAIHAREVAAPTLAKLAQLDDVVPAPTAAAVINGLATPMDRKLVFITRYGHFDGGLADLRRHAQFERLHPRFADPEVSPGKFVAESRHVQQAFSQELSENSPPASSI